MSRNIFYLLCLTIFLVQLTTSASIPTDHAELLQKVKDHPDYKKIAGERNRHREIALSEDQKSQDAYCKARNSCMPGGNVLRNIQGRYHKGRFERHTRRAKRESSKLDLMENFAKNTLSAQKQEMLQKHADQGTP
ncbi:uncharacterized protein FA14DRAFT_153511 [Meira miltonrushii]|uniref:Uncharacterized protein n=1 Tax=Meira miltonrushii TaxID=1280837 RepID=A0A316VPU8_9BASI|nr:uncharacterized protein FA14DRAFT_153511 [Meira miltonrushii]PWN38181.1 hypothetical protein FA14DRAFT_153511 [Meira miltonrushii]